MSGEAGTSMKAIEWNETSQTYDDKPWYGCATMTAMDMPTPVKLSRMIQHNSDSDGDGFDRNNAESSCGDNPNGNNPDLFPWIVPSVETVMGTAMVTTQR